jgi:type I restriction enzyme S subunit
VKSYRDFHEGPQWAPQIPRHWRHASLRWLADIYAGGTPDKGNLAYWTEGTIPWLNSGAVNDWAISTPSAFITAEGYASSSAKWVPAGSVVMGLAGQGKTKGTAARLQFDATTNQSMAAMVPHHELDYRFLHFWLVANYQSIRNLAGGDLRDGLNLQHLASIELPLPPLDEQLAIADYLDREMARIGTLIEEQQELIKMLQERRRSMRTQVALRGTRATDLGPSPLPWAESIPVEWTIVPLTAVARLESGHTPSRTRDDWWQDCYIPWISLNDVGAMRVAKYIERTANQLSDKGIANSSARLLPAKTVVLSRDATVGKTAIMKIPMATSQHFAAWICGPLLDPEYLWCLFTDAMQPHFDSFQNGSTIRTIGMGDLKAIRIPLPPVDEQRRIVAYLDEQTAMIDTLIAETETFIELAQERRSALITAAVTGQIDVRDAA